MHGRSIADILHVMLADYTVLKGNKLDASMVIFFVDIVYSQCQAESLGPVQEAASRFYFDGAGVIKILILRIILSRGRFSNPSHT